MVLMLAPLTMLLLVRVLLAGALDGTRAGYRIQRVARLGFVLVPAAGIAPFPVFVSTLGLAWVVTAGIGAWTFLHAARTAPSRMTWWFFAGVTCEAIAVVADRIAAAGGTAVQAWFQPGQAAIVAALLTGVAVGTTISEERRRRRTLQAEAINLLGRFEAVYRSVPIGLVSLDRDGRPFCYNEGFAQLFGLPGAAMRRADLAHASLLGSAFPHALRQRIVTELAHAPDCDFEVALPADDGAQQWLHILARQTGETCEASITDVTGQHRLKGELERAARRDPLTGALNRLGLTDCIEQILAQEPDVEHVALCYVDLDRFKMLNDLFGHRAGDIVLVQVVKRLQRALGTSVQIARPGGDEFVIVLPPADQSVQEGLAWRALEAITDEPFHIDERSFSVTASIGVFHLVTGMGQADLIAGADRACLNAKRQGRNQVVMCSDSRALARQRLDELELVDRLSGDHGFDCFELHAQPIVPLTDAGGTACEILLRYRTEAGELRTAGSLIAAAIQNGTMGRIDRWVLGRTIEWLSSEPEQSLGLDFVSVNLCGGSINDEFFKTWVIAQLRRHAAVAHRLVLEISESIAMQDVVMTGKFIAAVRETGARTALDDFGAGYSNFSALAGLPVSFLKIDGRFIRAVNEQASAGSVIRTITTLAHELHMGCIAEWVEDADTLELLLQYGVDRAQGRLLAPPMPLHELPLAGARFPRSRISVPG